MIHGSVVDITPDGADEHIDRLAQKYLGVEVYPWRESGERRVILRVRVDRASAG